MLILTIGLPAKRNRCGALTLAREGGAILLRAAPAAGFVCSVLATAHNPGREPVLPYGDTPTGTFRLAGVYASGDGTSLPARHFGPHGVIALEAISGQALIAASAGRGKVLMHGGPPGPHGRLRGTAGALRLTNEDMLTLRLAVDADPELSVLCYPDESTGGALVYDDPQCKLTDTLDLATLDVAPPARLAPKPESLSRRDIMRGGGAALIMPVSFFATAPAAFAQTAYNDQGTQNNAAPDNTQNAIAAPAPDNSQGTGDSGAAGNAQGAAAAPDTNAPDTGNGGQQVGVDIGGNGHLLTPDNAAPQGPQPADSAMQQLENLDNASGGSNETLQQGYDGGGPQGGDAAQGSVPDVATPDAVPVPDEETDPPVLAQNPQYQAYKQTYNQAAARAAAAAEQYQAAQRQLSAALHNPNATSDTLTAAVNNYQKAQSNATWQESQAKAAATNLQQQKVYVLDSSSK
jgi:hypothetical protein